MPRLLLGRYDITESRGYYTHHGYLGTSSPVRVTEVPPLREESSSAYYSAMEDAIQVLKAPINHVILVVKFSSLSPGGFRLDKESNIPERELETLMRILGDGLRNIVSVVVSNWSRQFARISDRRQKGINEDIVMGKLRQELYYALNKTTFPVYFMDTVFWRTEQKGGNDPNALPTTIETLDGLIKDMTGDQNASNGVNGYFNTVKKIDKRENIQVIKKTEEVNVDSSTDSSDDDDMETKIRLGERWRNKRYQDLSEKEYKKDMETSTISFPVHKKVNIEIVSKQTPQTANNIYSDYEIQRAVPARIRSRSSSSSSHRSTPIPVKSDTLSTKEKQRVELSDYVEAKVKEMMDKEGVTLDFTDNKIRGKIVTKTTIIKEVTDSHGSSQFVEDEVIDEKNFGSDLDSMSSMSLTIAFLGFVSFEQSSS